MFLLIVAIHPVWCGAKVWIFCQLRLREADLAISSDQKEDRVRTFSI